MKAKVALLYLGNLDARRDWGPARDFIEAQWLMLQGLGWVARTPLKEGLARTYEHYCSTLGQPA